MYTYYVIELFQNPVDWRAMGLQDYPELIKKPMDLGSVRTKLNCREYDAYHDCVEDIRLIWRNCMSYNSVLNSILPYTRIFYVFFVHI